ncbi:MAG: hypothetical protein AAF226_04910 [Verrucomicrobiota bacterium]
MRWVIIIAVSFLALCGCSSSSNENPTLLKEEWNRVVLKKWSKPSADYTVWKEPADLELLRGQLGSATLLKSPAKFEVLGEVIVTTTTGKVALYPLYKRGDSLILRINQKYYRCPAQGLLGE